MEPLTRLRTTVVVEYEVHSSVVEERCNRLTRHEQAEWLALYAAQLPNRIVLAKTERVDPASK